MLVRLQKLLADAGIASRRASEKLILDGRVRVNGAVVAVLGTRVDPDHDRVEADGALIKQRKKLYIAVHKPKGFVCSMSDPEGRRLIGDLLPREWNNLKPVGRLDFKSEGLIFMTNDGDFSLRLTHPRYGIAKHYRVTLPVAVDIEMVHRLTDGIFSDGERLKAERARIVKSGQKGAILDLVLREGKNREIRRMFEAQGIFVERLVRTQIGPIKLGELPEGRWRTLTEAEIKSLIQPTRE